MNRGTKRRGVKTPAEETPIKVLKPTAAAAAVVKVSPPPPAKEVPTKVVTPKQKAVAKVKPTKKGY